MKLYDSRPVEIRVSRGGKVHELIRRLQQNKVKIRNLQYLKDEVVFEISRSDVKVIRKLRRKYELKVRISYLYESRIFQKTGWTMVGLTLMIIIPILFSQIVWQIEVEAETPELRVAVEKVIDEKLNIEGPILKRNIVSDFEIRQIIMEELRDLSWVHILKKGSSITIVPQLAPITDNKSHKSDGLHHLIASKSGVITHFDITSGERLVTPNMTVYKGDILVSGLLTVGEDKSISDGVSGEVYADYWLETDFEVHRNFIYILAYDI